jgi:glycosyltransferase involved in cell wall biosynthesis
MNELAISVVIATYNRVALLADCLQTLFNQTLAPDRWELVVVDDGSRDGTPDLLAEHAAHGRLRGIRQDNRGQCAAANSGVEVSAGRFVLLLDDDILAEPELLAEHLDAQETSGGAVAVGRLAMRLLDGADRWVHAFASGYNDHFARLAAGRKPTFYDCYGNNLSFPRAAFLEVGGFVRDLPRGYDWELAFRLERSGLPVRFASRARATQVYLKDGADVVRENELEGVATVMASRRHAALAERTPLVSYPDSPRLELILRQLLLSSALSPRRLLDFAPIFPTTSLTHRYLAFVQRYSFWYGVSQNVSPGEWQLLQQGDATTLSERSGTA